MLTADWQEIVDALATAVRDVRTLLGWTQQVLADYAVVSQGMISRLETGHCAAIPFHSVVVVLRTLAAGATGLDLPLSPPTTQLLAFAAAMNGNFSAIAPPDADLAYIARTLRHMPRPRRAAFLAVVRAAATLGGHDDA